MLGEPRDFGYLRRLKSTLASNLLFVDSVDPNKKGGHIKARNIDKVGLLQVGKIHLTMEIVDFAGWVKDKTADGVIEAFKWPSLKEEPKPEKVEARKLQAQPPEMMVEGPNRDQDALSVPRLTAHVNEIMKSLKANDQY